jgi:hypothetical protein
MVKALVVKRIGLNKKIGRAWLDVEYPWEHPKIKREESQPPYETERKNTNGEFCEIRTDFDDATTYNDNYKNRVDGIEVCEKMIEPIINSFVHQTSWAEDLRRFSKVAEAWMDSVKSLGVDFFKSEGFSDCIQEMAQNDCYADVKCDEWWKGFEETRTEHFAQFKTTLEHFTRRLSQLICDLDEVFLIKNTCPKTLEFARKRLGWELLAVDYVRHEGKTAHLFHYGTAGEYFFYKDFVPPEQQQQEQQRSDDFMEQKRRGEYFMNSGMMTS